MVFSLSDYLLSLPRVVILMICSCLIVLCLFRIQHCIPTLDYFIKLIGGCTGAGFSISG